MIRVKLAALSAAAVVVLLTACGGDDNGKATAGAGELPQRSEPVELDPASFTPDVDNPYWPMEPGTRS